MATPGGEESPRPRVEDRAPRTVKLLAPLAQDLAEWRLACGRPELGALIFPTDDELELVRHLVRHDRTAVSTALLVIAGIGGGESRRQAVLSQLFDEARAARAEGAINFGRADQIARHVRRALRHVEPALAA